MTKGSSISSSTKKSSSKRRVSEGKQSSVQKRQIKYSYGKIFYLIYSQKKKIEKIIRDIEYGRIKAPPELLPLLNEFLIQQGKIIMNFPKDEYLLSEMKEQETEIEGIIKNIEYGIDDLKILVIFFNNVLDRSTKTIERLQTKESIKKMKARESKKIAEKIDSQILKINIPPELETYYYGIKYDVKWDKFYVLYEEADWAYHTEKYVASWEKNPRQKEINKIKKIERKIIQITDKILEQHPYIKIEIVASVGGGGAKDIVYIIKRTPKKPLFW